MAAATNSSSNSKPDPVNAKEYYGYLYEPNKTPTAVLDALLRAIGQYIIDEVGDKTDRALNPTKLAAFYKAVGGDYDRLFINAPHESISYIWQVFGCQHTLQPTDNDFEAPTIPALTLRGFVRWESIQVLLSPDEHVPFITYAVDNWHLKDLETSEPFPAGIPAEAFPSEPDPDISAWHAACGDKLRQEATPKDATKESSPKESPKDSPKDSPKPAFSSSAADRLKDAYSHVPAPGGPPAPAPAPAPRPRPPTGLNSDYFNHRTVPYTHVNPSTQSVPYTHVNPGHSARYPRGAPVRVSPERVDRHRRNGSSAEDAAREDRSRRRSFSDYPSPQEQVPSAHLNPGRTIPPRRHSHPRGHSSDESDSEGNMSPRSRRSSGHHSSTARGPKAVPRFVHVAAPSSPVIPPAVPNAPAAVQIPSIRTEGGTKLRADDRDSSVGRRKSAPFVEGARDWAKDKFDKFSTMLPGASPEKPTRRTAGSGGSGGIPIDRLDRMSRDSLSAPHMSRSLSYEDGSESDSEEERERRRQRKRREKERERERRERDREREREVYERDIRDRVPRRSREPPPVDWDDVSSSRDRPRSRKDEARYKYEASDVRDRDRYGDDRRRRVDDRSRDRERMPSPVIKGVGGRRYAEPPLWADD